MTLADLQSQACRQSAIVLSIYLALFGAGIWYWTRWRGVEATVFNGFVCFLPAMACAALACTSTADPRQYLVRILACAMFTPVLLLFWSADASPAAAAPARLVWPGAVGAAAVHVVAFVGAIYWMGTTHTRVPAEPGSTPVSAAGLHQRLLQLNRASAPFVVTSPSPNEVIVAFRFAAGSGRSHSARLLLDAAKQQVRVRERLSADEARPRSASERSMRGPTDPYFDPTRPEAVAVSETVTQTTMIDLGRLVAVPVTMTGSSADVPASHFAALDGEGMVTLLCAVVTRSGWSWQPLFFGN